jgi:hypothetical protein
MAHSSHATHRIAANTTTDTIGNPARR